MDQLGTQHSDEMTSERFVSNNARAILGGISIRQDVVVSIAIKPTSAFGYPDRRLMSRGTRRVSKRMDGMIRASAFAQPRLPKRFLRWCRWTTRCGIVLKVAMSRGVFELSRLNSARGCACERRHAFRGSGPA
jgi:hypothetical protein